VASTTSSAAVCLEYSRHAFYKMSSSSSSSSSKKNIIGDDDVVVADIDVDEDAEQKVDNDGSILSSRTGDPQESASTKKEEAAVDDVKEDCKDEETIEESENAKVDTLVAAADIVATTSTTRAGDGVPPAAAHERNRSEDRQEDIHSLSSSSSSSSARPGAYRVGPNMDDEDEVTGTSTFVQSHALPDEQQQYEVQGIGVEALVDVEAAQILQQEREQQPLVEAVIQCDKENDENSLSGRPKWLSKLLFLCTMMALVVLAIYFAARPKPTTMAPTAAPTTDVTAQDPIIAMFDLLIDYVPAIDALASSQPSSTEYRAVEWLVRNNYTSNLSQRYAMAVLYLETGGATGLWFNSTFWLSEEPLCDWHGVGCNGTKITKINLRKCGGKLQPVLFEKPHNTARTVL
jgi:hypothetical protein